jgi:AcrR family transcriptional regulator
MSDTSDLSTRDRRRIRTSELILRAARDLLEENGLEKLTLADIAQRADYSKPAIYEYFDGIENLLSELSNSGFIQLGERLKTFPKTLPPDERLVAMGGETLGFAAENPELYKLMFSRIGFYPQGKADTDLKNTMQISYRVLVDTIQEGIEKKIFKTRAGFDWKAMTYITWTLIHGMASLKKSLMDELDYDVDLCRSQAFRFLISSLKGAAAE